MHMLSQLKACFQEMAKFGKLKVSFCFYPQFPLVWINLSDVAKPFFYLI